MSSKKLPILVSDADAPKEVLAHQVKFSFLRNFAEVLVDFPKDCLLWLAYEEAQWLRGLLGMPIELVMPSMSSNSTMTLQLADWANSRKYWLQIGLNDGSGALLSTIKRLESQMRGFGMDQEYGMKRKWVSISYSIK